MEPELKIPVQRTPRVSAPLQHDRFDGAHDGYTDRFSHMYEFSWLRAPGNTGRNTLIRWYAKGCQFVKTHSDATFMRRTKTHAQNGEGLVLVRRFHNSRSRATMGDIAAASEKWGFTSDRDFKRAFGVAPGSLVNTARQGAR